ncbi:MAG: hydroxymethylbilane synthase, partial [Clostridia bacterium]|nr:hydroxymethylbilane synthase [Clostridia bacterium]
TAERAFMRKLEGGCQVPMGALAQIVGSDLILSGVVADLDGQQVLKSSCQGSRQQAEFLGENLAQKLLEQGAGEILEKVREFTYGK